MSLLDDISAGTSAAAAAAGAGVQAATNAVVTCKDGSVRQVGQCGEGNNPGDPESSKASVLPLLLIGVVAAVVLLPRVAKANASDPFYVVQELLGDRVVQEGGSDDEQEAVSMAKSWSRDVSTEGDRVRVITRDGEHVKTFKVR